MDDCARAGLDRQVARNCAVEDETDAPMQRRIARDHAIEGDILLDGEGDFDLVVHRAHYAAASMSVRSISLPFNNSGSSVALPSTKENQQPKSKPACGQHLPKPTNP